MKRWILIPLMVTMLLGAGPSLAAAQEAPTATPIRQMQVEDGHFIALSPDGSMIAVAIQATALCVYDAATFAEMSCGSLERLDSGIRYEDIVWSPDSTKLAFAERSFVTAIDGDLWVMDAASGDIANLTDDGFAGSILGFDDASDTATFFIDVAPAWTPDSQYITFSRSGWNNGERTGNQIAQIAATGGDVEILTSVSADVPGIVYFGTGWSPDGQTFYFSLTDPDLSNPENGIWTYDAATGQTAQLTTGLDPDLGPLTMLQVSAAGNLLLAWYPMAYGQIRVDAPLLRLVDTTTGELSVPPLPAGVEPPRAGLTLATFSPSGTALLQVIDLGERKDQFWVTDLATGAQTMVLDDIESAFMETGLTPSWGANGNAAIAYSDGGVSVTTISGIGTAPVAIPQPTASPMLAAGTLAPGASATVAGLAPVFAAPDPNAVVVLMLAPNDTVQILGAPIENDFGVWYPVIDPDTQTIGYVQANRLGA